MLSVLISRWVGEVTCFVFRELQLFPSSHKCPDQRDDKCNNGNYNADSTSDEYLLIP